MQASGIVERRGIMRGNFMSRPEVPLLARFLGKFVLDILPAALASVIGGFLFTQYHSSHLVTARLATEQVTPASAEMMAMVRDEHAMMMDYLKSQMAAEKSRAAAEDAAAARAVADAKAADDEVPSDASTGRVPVAVAMAKPVAARARTTPAPAAAPHAPLLIAQADQNASDNALQSDAAAPAGRLARDPDSLLAKTLDFKDDVVAATRHVVGMIGGVFSTVGETIGGSVTGTRQFSSAS
jgi:hypothetical protein